MSIACNSAFSRHECFRVTGLPQKDVIFRETPAFEGNLPLDLPRNAFVRFQCDSIERIHVSRPKEVPRVATVRSALLGCGSGTVGARSEAPPAEPVHVPGHPAAQLTLANLRHRDTPHSSVHVGPLVTRKSTLVESFPRLAQLPHRAGSNDGSRQCA